MGRSSLCAAALFAVLLAVVGAASAQPERAPCDWDTAEPVTVRGLDSVEGGAPGRCVRLRAELDGWMLSDVRPHRGLRAAQTDFIGAYSHSENLMDSFNERPRRVEVLGRVGHCGDICAEGETRDAEGNVVICMATGFCHYHDDPYVMIDAVR
jgi:hypothetical protein